MKNEKVKIYQIKTVRILQYNLWRYFLFSLFIVFISFSVLLAVWQPKYAWQWLFQTIFVLTYVLRRFWVALPLNSRPNEESLLGRLGPGSYVTFVRGSLLSMLAGFLFMPWPGKIDGLFWLTWVPGLIYLSAAAADFLDGFLARMTHHETILGEILDKEMDALGLLVAPLLAVGFAQIPIIYLTVSGAYYLFTFGIWLRKKYGKHLVELTPGPYSRMLAGFQMGFVGAALLPLFSPPVTTIAALVFMTPLLLGFVKDWLAVCGHPGSDGYKRAVWENTLKRYLTLWLPLFLRFMASGMGFFLVRRFHAMDLNSWWGVYVLFIIIMLVSGIMGRTAALLLGFSTALIIKDQGPNPELLILYACSIALVCCGTGSFSLWKPEDRLLLRRAGEGHRFPG